MGIKFEGYGYEWDAELAGGPCDGLIDRAVRLNEKDPPAFLVKILGRPMKQSKIGEKVLEDWEATSSANEKVAVYKLEKQEENTCYYQYVETLAARQYQDKYL